MEIKNEYGKSNVVVLKIGQEDVDGLLINWDVTDDGKIGYMEKEFINIVMNYLPEYALGYDSKLISQLDIVPKLREAANSVIKIKKINEIKEYLDNETPHGQWEKEILKTYNSKGIFSELIFHFLLRDIKGTLPLISKIYFKDSNAVEAHGFDSVHISDDKLWLGETKFYNDGKKGINALINDLNKHFKHDYLKEQFVIIKRALVPGNEERDKWIEQLSKTDRLEEMLSMIYIPLLCIYEDNVATNIIDELNQEGDHDKIYFDHVISMKEYFDKNNNFPNKNRVQPLLILLPVESKDRIVTAMLTKIYNMQNV